MRPKFTFLFFFAVALFTLGCTASYAKTARKLPAFSINNANVYVDKAVAGFPDISKIQDSGFQLISHGRPGQLLLDGQWLDAAQIALFIQRKHLLTGNVSRLNIYGCEFGKGLKGSAAIAYLQETLGVAIAASDDITGKDGDWELEAGAYVSIKGLETYSGNLQYAGTDDFDGDGVINASDIDDDNDGVPDAVESPSCFYTASEWNTGVKPANTVTITSALTTTTSNFNQLLDSVTNVTAVTFSNAPAQPIQDVDVYLFTFTYPVRLDALYLKFNTATQFAGTTKLQGSNTNNGTDWVDLSAAVSQTAGTNTTVNGAVSVTTSIKYPVTLNTTTAYKYIRITGAAASNIAAQNASEVYFDINVASYIASYYPKASCADANIDGDNIPPHFDLDSDGDGCSDAYESGATINTTANYQFPDVDANNDGLADAVDADGNGVVDYASTYHAYAQSGTVQSCNDSDGDGMRDIVDIDDDNDGIPDIEEQMDSGCSTTNCDSWISPPTTASTVAGTTMVDGEEVSYTMTINTNITPQSSAGYTLQCTGENVVGLPYWQRVDANNQTVTFNFSKPVTNFQIIMAAIESAPPGLIESIQVTTNNVQGQQTICESCDKSGISVIDTQNLMVYGNGTGTEIFRVSGPTFTTITVKVTSVGGAYLMAYGLCALKSYSDLSYTDIDTDNDGIPNRLDLDSDGDGCPDLKEAAVSPATDVITPSVTNNVGVSYGIADPAGAQLNPAATDANNDGLNDSVDPDVNGSPDYSGSYYPLALQATLQACLDSDGDGINNISDIDDDNDGILDAEESAICFYMADQLKDSLNITSELSYFNSNPFSLALDGNTSTYALAVSGLVINRTVCEFKLPLATPLSVATVTIQLGINNAFPVSSFQLEGWTGNTWEALSATQAMATANTTYTFTNTLFPSKAYNRFRIRGLAGYVTSGTRIHEVNVTFNQAFINSAQPKENCTGSDTDGDGIANYLDLDSDGDGCPDAVEAGISSNSGTSGSMSSSGGAIYSGGIAPGTANAYVGNGSPGQYGANGYFNAIETSVESGVYNGSSTYSLYALANNRSTCADTDGDGIPDLADIDDDNDGVLDATESPACFYTEAEMSVPQSISTTMAIGSGDNVNDLKDGVLTGGFNFTAQALADDTILVFSVNYPAMLDTVAIQMNATTTSTTNGFGASGATAKVQGFNGAAWVDISAETNIAGTTLGRIYFVITDATNNYAQYRIMGVAVANSNTNPIGELIVSTRSPHISSMYPKPTCATDTDNDGILNHLDLDSDGDKCPDAYEAGTYNKPGVTAGAGAVQNGSGGAVTSTLSTVNAVINGPYSGNGFADALQAAADSNSYNYTYTYNIATDSTQKACCIASATAPVLTKTTDTVCGSNTYDLNSIVSGTAPAYNAVAWFTDNTHTNAYTTAATAVPGTYYAFYKDTVNNCFSPASAAFTLASKPLPAGSASPQTICSGSTSAVLLNSTISGSTYTWTAAVQSGSAAGFSNCTSGCGSTIAQALTGSGVVRYTVTPLANGCAGNTFTVDVTVSSLPVTTIAYSGSPYLSGSGTVNVTQTGQAGGTYSVTPSGLSINASTGQVNINNSFANVYTVKYVFGKGTCTDSVTTTLTIIPTNDTLTSVPACPTCPVTLCAVVDDVDTTGGAIYSTPCGTPAGYTAGAISTGGCITYTPAGLVSDTSIACIVTCNNGKCDTTRVILYPPVPTNDTVTAVPSCPTCPVVVCPVFDDVSPASVSSITTCSTPAGYTLIGPDVSHCYTYSPNGSATDTAESCIIVCDGSRCDTTRITIYPPMQTISHDWNVGFVNMQITGNIAANDLVYANTAYSNIQANAGNPTAQLPVLNSNGTYTFTASQTGKYTFIINVCAPGQSAGCPTQFLVVNVADTTPNTNAMPIANPDIVTTTYQTAIGIPTLDNDASGNYGGALNPSSVTITDVPAYGTIDSIGANGDIYYQPGAGFTGTDTLVYSVCDQLLPSNCDTAYQIITVLPLNAANTTAASDDYGVTLSSSPATGNVLSNDIDPEGHNLVVTPATVNNASGTFTIDDAGNYTFTPAANFVGSTYYAYQVCDNGSPIACATATIYILVYPENTTPLPVKIVDFTGKAQSNHTNLLIWKAVDVKGMERYEIRKSTDQKTWTPIGSIAAENKDGMQVMHLIDNNPDKEDFYRLMLNDKNGQISIYPKVVYIRRAGSLDESAAVYPNPAEATVNFEYNSILADADIQIEILDVTGRRVKQISARLSAGKNTFPISIKDLADGSYMVRYHNSGNGSNGSLKFIKGTK